MPGTDEIRVFLDERLLSLADRIDGFAAERIAPLPDPMDDGAARSQAREILTLLGEAGWLEPVAEQDLRGIALCREALAHASPLADAVYALQGLGGTPLVLAGGSISERWLGGIVAGRIMTAFAMTEPEAGSDIASMKTRATRDGEGWVLDGTKTFISNAGIADLYVTFATTDPEAGHRGIACFAVPADADGLVFDSAQILSAPHPLGTIRFDRCRVTADGLLAGPGDGFKLGLATLDRLRATVAAAACGMARRALDEALAHAVAREQFGEPLAEFQLVKEKLARMATELAAARLLTYRAAWEKDGGTERVTLESAMAKAFATEAAQRIVDAAVQILGGRGVLANHPVDRLYRAVRALRIYEGTTEIQRLVVAGQLIERARERERDS